jgi:hypothetical protein
LKVTALTPDAQQETLPLVNHFFRAFDLLSLARPEVDRMSFERD